jgi:hypothetical protein
MSWNTLGATLTASPCTLGGLTALGCSRTARSCLPHSRTACPWFVTWSDYPEAWSDRQPLDPLGFPSSDGANPRRLLLSHTSPPSWASSGARMPNVPCCHNACRNACTQCRWACSMTHPIMSRHAHGHATNLCPSGHLLH